MKRRRHHNGIITGYRHREWWIGARHNFEADAWEFNLFGLTCYVPQELLTLEITTRTMRQTRVSSRENSAPVLASNNLMFEVEP